MDTILCTDKVKNLLVARRNLYGFLQTLFSSPLDADRLKVLKENCNLEELYLLGRGGTALNQFLMSNVHLHDEEEEYKRLFLGPGPLPAPPWESVYTSEEELLFDASMYDVRDMYHQAGLKFIRENREPDDHLVIELEFMAYLAECSLKALETDRIQEFLEVQFSFLENHLIRWIPEFAEKLSLETTSFLYRGSAYLLADFITEDRDSLIELMEGLANAREE